jgi:hypothetical protein
LGSGRQGSEGKEEGKTNGTAQLAKETATDEDEETGEGTERRSSDAGSSAAVTNTNESVLAYTMPTAGVAVARRSEAGPAGPCIVPFFRPVVPRMFWDKPCQPSSSDPVSHGAAEAQRHAAVSITDGYSEVSVPGGALIWRVRANRSLSSSHALSSSGGREERGMRKRTRKILTENRLNQKSGHYPLSDLCAFASLGETGSEDSAEDRSPRSLHQLSCLVRSVCLLLHFLGCYGSPVPTDDPEER